MTEPSDEEWLLARERGDDISHIPAQRRARYEQLDKLIAALPDRAPPAGWKRRVLDALDAPAVRSPSIARRRRTWAFAGATAAVGIVVVLLVITPGTGGPPTEPVVITEVRRGDKPHRGGEVSVGDTLVVHARSDRPIELRVYDDTGEPLARCTETQGCAVERSGASRRYALELVLRSPGNVRTVLFIVAGVVLEPLNNLDADLAAALNANVEVRQVGSVHVQ